MIAQLSFIIDFRKVINYLKTNFEKKYHQFMSINNKNINLLLSGTIKKYLIIIL